MRNLKKIVTTLALCLCMVLGSITVSAAAADSPSQRTIKTVALKATSFTYNGKAKTPGMTVKDAAGRTLVMGTDYKLTYKNNIKAGTASVTFTGMGAYAGKTVTKKFTIKRQSPVVGITKQGVTSKTLTPLKTKERTVGKINYFYANNGKYSKISKGVSMTFKSSSPKIVKVSSTGVITLAKKAKAGTYKITVRIAQYGKNMAAVTRTITIVVK